MTDDKSGVWLDAVYNAETTEQLADGYDGWARDYDRDLAQYGYRLPALAAGMIGRHVPGDCGAVIDAGCGTGLLGEALAPMGYAALDGLDLSEKMLAVARSKQIYRTLFQARLGDTLGMTDGAYGAVVSIGTFTVGHAGPEGYDELIRITKPGGWLVMSMRTDIDPDNPYRARIDELVEVGAWEIVEASGEIVTMPWEDETIRNCVIALRKAG